MSVKAVNIFLLVWGINRVPSPFIALGAEQDVVLDAPVLATALAGVAVGAGAFPDNLRLEVDCAKQHVNHQADEVAGRGVAVQVDAAVGLQHPVQFCQARRHHGQVSHHVALPQEAAQRLHQVRQPRRAAGHNVVVRRFGLRPPPPSVAEGGNLSLGMPTAVLPKQHVVVGVGVERRVQVNQVHAFVGNLLPEDRQIVAKVKLVWNWRSHGSSPGSPRKPL